MGRIQIDLFATLDLVAQAPGGPSEDPEDGFKFGGWQAPFADEVVGEQIVAGIAAMDALLLGRKTYDIFAEYWPRKEDASPTGSRKSQLGAQIRRFSFRHGEPKEG